MTHPSALVGGASPARRCDGIWVQFASPLSWLQAALVRSDSGACQGDRQQGPLSDKRSSVGGVHRGKPERKADEEACPHRSPGRGRSPRPPLRCTCGRRLERPDPCRAKLPGALPRLAPCRAAGASPRASTNIDPVGLLPGRGRPGLPPRRADPHLDLRPGLAAALLPCEREGECGRTRLRQGRLLVPGCPGRTLPALPRRRAVEAERLRLALSQPASASGRRAAALRLRASARAHSGRGAGRPSSPSASLPRPR